MSQKGFTFKLGADTQDFIKGIRAAEKEIGKTQKTANNLSKSLDFKFSDTKLTAAQKQYQKALAQTEANADGLRKKLHELEESGRVDTVDYSELELLLAKTETRADRLRQELEKLDEVKVEKLSEKFENLGGKLTNAGKKMQGLSLGATGILAGGAAIVKSAATTGAEIDDLSQRFDVSAETIQRWQYLAMQGGVNVDVFTKGLVKMRAAVADVAAGTSNKATESLFALGLDPTKFSSTEEMVNAITQALASMENKTLQTAYANEIFGDKIATEMLQYINAGVEDIAKWNAEFDAMSPLTSEQVKNLADLDDQFNRLKTSMSNAGAELGLAFAPIMEKAIEWIENYFIPAIENLAEKFDKLPEGVQNFLVGGLALIAFGTPFLKFCGGITGGIGRIVKAFKDLEPSQLKAAGGFMAILAAAGLAFALFENWGKMEAWQRVLGVIGVLTVAALGLAMAFGAFHSALTMGFAVAGIVAGIAAVSTALLTAKDQFDVPDTVGSSGTPSSSEFSYNPDDYTIPEYTESGNSYTENSSNDTYNVTIVIEGSELSKEEIAEEVSKKIATLAQARG